MQIIVRDNNVDQALRALKKKLQREGVYREMKLRRHYEKPSEKRARERAAAIRRARKLERKRAARGRRCSAHKSWTANAPRAKAPAKFSASENVRRRSRSASRPHRPGRQDMA